MANRDSAITPEVVQTKTAEFVQAYVTAFGEDGWTLKFHLAQHIGPQWKNLIDATGRAKMMLPNVLALERKHKCVKKVMLGHCNTVGYERAILEEMTLDHLHSLEGPTTGLVTPRPCRESSEEHLLIVDYFPRIPVHAISVRSVYISKSGARFYVGDVVLFTIAHVHAAGRILAHYGVRDQIHTALQYWPLLTVDQAEGTALYHQREDIQVVPTSVLHSAVIYKHSGDLCMAILPAGYDFTRVAAQ